MILNDLKKRIGRNLINLPGWHTSRKIVVIESDDWGSIRMSSKEVYYALLKAGVPVDKDPYSKFDALASEEDLINLFEVLESVKDKNGNSAVITANCVVANPNFEKIENSAFSEYHYEPFTKTLKKYPNHQKSFELWMQGIKNKVFFPQLHGREHVNVQLWMQALKNNDVFIREAFKHQVFGVPTKLQYGARGNYMAAFDLRAPKYLKVIESILNDACKLFEKIFGYNSLSFIAPCYIWSEEVEKVLSENGVKSLQGIRLQSIPLEDSVGYYKKSNYTGKGNNFKQIYTVRNAVFEPSPYQERNTEATILECLKGIERAFRWGKPAIISAHRINFIGYLNEKNRDINLNSLKKLLNEITKLWPDVEFLNSSTLVSEIIDSNKSFIAK